MSGTSLDGVDAVLANTDGNRRVLKHAFLPYPDALRQALLSLHVPQRNELETSQLIAIQLTKLYAQTITRLLSDVDSGTRSRIRAIGCHGQTVRHRPDLGFTLQLNNPALLAELTGLTVIADFRSRDIAAGGQGAPLVPAFHQACFAHPAIHRAILNIGGISNLTDLPPSGQVTGFDCGPGNLLMDAWCQRHIGQTYDKNGAWAQNGECLPDLLANLLTHPFFAAPPPKSTGRDDFHLAWLERHLIPAYLPQNVQATLLELSCSSIAEAVKQHCPGTQELYVCGGGAKNAALMQRLNALLPNIIIATTDSMGIAADWVEAVAFAWLARQTLHHQPGNLPAVTGAVGPRILGAIYPA